jgi:hypothetical protein
MVEGIAEGVGVGVAEGVGVGVAEGVGVGKGTGFAIATPLSHTNFFPDFMQVYCFPADIAVEPALVQLAPALGVAAKIGELMENRRPTKTVTTILFCIQKG